MKAKFIQFTIYMINMSKLKILGFSEKHIYFVICLLGLWVIYIFIQPFMHLMVSMQTIKLLGYIVSSFLFIFISLLILLFVVLFNLSYEKFLIIFKIIIYLFLFYYFINVFDLYINFVICRFSKFLL